jgi:hypothetical protein
MDGLHHVLEDRIEDLPRFLGVSVGEQFHRALEVGEKDRDLLALARERGLGRQDALGEMPRSVGRRAGDPRGDRQGTDLILSQRLTALPTEPRPRTCALSASRTHEFEATAALLAEGGIMRILVLASGAIHAAPDLALAVKS